MKLYFARHGESTANLLRQFSNGDSKHPLTEKGIEQARELAHSLSTAQIEKIYTSPVLRAVQTAQILNENLKAPVEITEALREWSVGIYEGTTDPKGWEAHRHVQQDWFIHHRLESKIPGGESFLEIQERFYPFIERLLQNKGESDRSILLIGHGALYVAMLPIICINVDFTFASQHSFSNTAYALAETRMEGLHCLSWCGIPMDSSS